MSTRRPVRVREREVSCRTILSRSGIPGFDFSVNPYTGCAHSCAYCYASYMQRYSGHDEPWGSFVDVKVNAVRVLLRQLRRTPPSSIFLSSVTDPYQPSEERYGITRRILQCLLPLPHSIHIHTKSDLVLRDIDLFARARNLTVSFTIVTGNGGIARLLEPGAPPVRSRLRALRKLSACGIRTGVFIGPVIPGVTERGLDSLLGNLVEAGVRRVVLDDLHYLARVRPLITRALGDRVPGMEKRLKRPSRNYYQQIGRYVLEFCRARGVHCICFF